MLNAALLGLMRQLGLDIITLTEELGESEFFASRITRMETLKLLSNMAKTVSDIPADVRAQLPQIDWATWMALPEKLARPVQHPFQIWVAIRELTPMTVQQLNDYKRTQPKLFSMVP